MRLPPRSALALLLLAGCASANFSGDATRVGASSGNFDEDLAPVSRAAATRVRVFVGQFPDGIAWKDGAISITDRDRWKLVGRVAATMDSPGESMLWFYDYPEDEAWRKAYCYPQVPLVWFTCSAWWLVPAYWPCFVWETNSGSDIASRKRRIVQTLRRGAARLGGNVLVVSSLGSMHLLGPPLSRQGQASGGPPVGELLDDGAQGYVFQDLFTDR